MGKKLLLGLVLIVLSGEILPARELSKNMVTFGINSPNPLFFFPPGSLGWNMGYGLFLNEKISLGIDMGTLIKGIQYAEAKGDWYPGSGLFHIGLGFGALRLSGILADFFPTSPSSFISAKVGWRIDIGNPNGWILVPGIKARVPINRPEWSIPVLPEFSVRLGYSF